MVNLFGFSITRNPIDSDGKKRSEYDDPSKVVSIVPPTSDDGSAIVGENGFYGLQVDSGGTMTTESDLITKYREMAQYPDVDYAIDDIVNEAISYDENDVVKLNMDGFDKSSVFNDKDLQSKIQNEFKTVLELLDFNNAAYRIFRSWYIDGRIFYHIIIDPKNPEEGIKELRNIDPRKLRKVKEVKRVPDPQGVATSLFRVANEYFVFSPTGFGSTSLNNNVIGTGFEASSYGLRIVKDSIAYAHSGLMDPMNSMVLSYLHKAMKVLNSLKSLEDSMVIYRYVRAPERRIFYIDVGNMPKAKAEQYMREMMVRHRNKMVYDQNTGVMRDDRKFMSLFEDYWLPRKDGGKGTQIDTLKGGEQLGKIEDIEYVQKKLYRALNVPISRMNPETSGFTFSKAAEISRDETKFSRFIDRLRRQFSQVLFECLSRQLILKKICNEEDIEELYRGAFFDFVEDNHYTEVKDNEILSRRTEVAKDMQDFVGNYFSHDFIRRKVFKQTDDDIKLYDAQIKKEKKDERYTTKDDGTNGIDVGDPTFGGMPGMPGMPMPGGMPMQPGMNPMMPFGGQQQQGVPSPQLINNSATTDETEKVFKGRKS